MFVYGSLFAGEFCVEELEGFLELGVVFVGDGLVFGVGDNGGALGGDLLFREGDFIVGFDAAAGAESAAFLVAGDVDVVLIPSEVVLGGDLHGGVVGEGHDGLDEALAVGAGADELGGFGVL